MIRLPNHYEDADWKDLSYEAFNEDGTCEPIFDDSKLYFPFKEYNGNILGQVTLDFTLDSKSILVDIDLSNNSGKIPLDEFNSIKVDKVFPASGNLDSDYEPIKEWVNSSLRILLNTVKEIHII